MKCSIIGCDSEAIQGGYICRSCRDNLTGQPVTVKELLRPLFSFLMCVAAMVALSLLLWGLK